MTANPTIRGPRTPGAHLSLGAPREHRSRRRVRKAPAGSGAAGGVEAGVQAGGVGGVAGRAGWGSGGVGGGCSLDVNKSLRKKTAN